MQTNKPNIRQRWNKAKLTKMTTFWIAILAIVLVLFLGFTRGGWVTGGTANRTAGLSAQTAVIERLGPICVAQYGEDSQGNEKLAELKSLSSSNQRANYVKEQGWATMPGEAEPDTKVAAECARLLLLTDE